MDQHGIPLIGSVAGTVCLRPTKAGLLLDRTLLALHLLLLLCSILGLRCLAGYALLTLGQGQARSLHGADGVICLASKLLLQKLSGSLTGVVGVQSRTIRAWPCLW